MSAIRTTFRWVFMLLALIGAVGGAAAWYAWVRSDDLVRDELLARLSQIAPSCDLQIGKVRFDWGRSITVRDLVVRTKGKDSPPTLIVPEVVINIDRERFVKDQTVDVQLIKLVRPRFDVTRRSDGTWSVEELAPFHLDPSIPVPEWQIEDAILRFRLEQENSEPLVLTLQEADLRLVPAGRRQLVVRGLSDVADAGPLEIRGKLNLDTERVTWALSGSVNGLNTSGNIAGFALRSSANLREQVAQLGDKLKRAENALLSDDESPDAVSNDGPFRTVIRDGSAPAPWERRPNSAPTGTADKTPGRVAAATPADLTGLGVNAVVDIRFAIEKPDPARAPTYQVTLDCRDGQVVNPVLPFALRHLRGQLHWNNEKLRLEKLHADGGGTSLQVDGDFTLGGEDPAGTITVAVTNLAVSDRYPGKLPPAVERFLQTVRPSGPIDINGTFGREPDGAWSARAFQLTAKGATAVPAPFPYPIQDIAGVLELTAPGRLEANMTGKVGVRPILLNAVVLNPGAEAEVLVEVTAASVVVDEGVREAFKSEVRTVLDRLSLKGVAEDLRLRLYRQPGPLQKYGWWLTTKVREAEILYQDFPYRVEHLAGDLDYSSETETLTLTGVHGVHDRADLTVSRATYRKPPANPSSPLPGTPPYGLTLPIVAQRVNLGGDLRAALRPDLKSLWDDLQPGGTADLAVQIAWLPGGPPDIRLPELKVTNGSLRMKAFPYLIDTIAASLAYRPGRLDIVDFVGWHDVTSVATRGSVFTLEPNDQWRLSLQNLVVDDLQFDAEFLRSAPAGLREAIEAIRLRGPEGGSPIRKLTGQIDLRGTRRLPTTTAGWNLTAELLDAAVDVGIELTNATGTVRCDGRFDGEETNLSGSLAFSSAKVFGQRLQTIRGPFILAGGQIDVGTRQALAGGPDAIDDQPDIPTDRHLTAYCLGEGLLTVDANVTLAEQPSYRGRATLTGGRLEYFAPSSRRVGMGNLSGVINGAVNFHGRGTDPRGLLGHGQLRIEPAALYQLPVVMQMFQALTTIAPAGALDNTAFKSATADFRIRDGGFEAYQPDGRIVLAGDSLRLVGGGRAEFDGRLSLDFYTTPPRNVARVLPVVGQIFNVAATGWIGVEVRGTTDVPAVRTVPLKALDDGWRQMLEALGPPPARTASGLRR